MPPTWPMPAQFTRISSCPIPPKACATAASLVISRIRTVEPGSSAESASARGRSISAIVTEAPAPVSARQVSSPIPLAPPVTRAVRPSRRNGVLMLFGGTECDQAVVHLRQFGGVEFDYFAIVRHQPVDFAFHIRRLRVDRGGQAFFHQRLQLLDQALIAGLQFGSIVERPVAPVALVPPEVLFERQSKPAEFA